MSEVRNYKKLTLGPTELIFIQLFGQRSYSAYELCHKTLKHTQPMSYPNTYRKVQRLHDLGLLEEVEGDFKRGAILYKLSTRGLFERLLFGGIPDKNLWWDYKDNIILQTLLYQYFQDKTIWKFRNTGYLDICFRITDYLKKCCEGVLNVKSESECSDVIFTELINFILKLVIASSIRGKYPGPFMTGPNSETYGTLRLDRKFFPYVREMKERVDTGCKIFGLN